jgi:NADPH:quinone reductase
MSNSITLRFFLIYEITPEQREAALAELSSLLNQATFKHSIGLRLPLREAASAHDRIEQGSVVGNVVLDIP